ncbi:MAG: glycosyltransferase family 2 protein [Flavobacteriales bacterium]
MSVLVSVIIPCYNCSATISRAVGSVFNQTHTLIEVICVDNNSNDETQQVLEKLKLEYPSLIVLSEIKQGAPAARNKGLNYSNGQLIQFLDADDELLLNKIEHQVEIFLGADIAPSFIVAGYYKQSFNKDGREYRKVNDNLFVGLFSSNLGITSANLFSKFDLLEVGGWDENLKSSQEYDLMFRLLKNSENVLIDHTPLTIIHVNQEGGERISTGNQLENLKRLITLRLRIKDFLQTNKKPYFKEHQNKIYQILFDQIRSLANYDLTLAVELYRKEIPDYFIPQVSETTTKNYIRLFRLFGFEKAEKLKKRFSKIRN